MKMDTACDMALECGFPYAGTGTESCACESPYLASRAAKGAEARCVSLARHLDNSRSSDPSQR
jgi:hypothetical protein